MTSPPKHYYTLLKPTNLNNQVDSKSKYTKLTQNQTYFLQNQANIIKAESSSNSPLQRCSPQKYNKAKQKDFQALKNTKHDLDQFIQFHKENIVFKSRISQIGNQVQIQKLKQIKEQNKLKNETIVSLQQENHLLSSEKKQIKMMKPPTPKKIKPVQNLSSNSKHKKQNIQSSLTRESFQFFDNFQSSNLQFAIKHDQSTYFLTLRLDSNTNAFSQWFYFKIKNPTQYDQHCRLIIINMTKSQDSVLFGKGLKPSVCRCNVWGKQGRDICYWKNSFFRKKKINKKNQLQSEQNQNDNIRKTNDTAPQLRKNKYLQNLNLQQNKHSNYYSLGFTIFLHAHQQVYIAYSQPYTYTRLYKTLLDTYQEQNKTNNIFQRVKITRSLLTKTFLDNRVEMITISQKHKRTSEKKSIQKARNNSQKKLRYSSNQKKESKQKGIILILGRCHPCQTASSFIIEGIIQELMQLPSMNMSQSNSNTEHPSYLSPLKLLQKYKIKIIPMINPDGVIIGNSRTNLKGYDLNKQWKQTNNENTPQVFAIKKAIDQIKSKIVMIFDIHSILKKKNIWFEGFYEQKIQNPFQKRQENQAINSKEFIYFLSKLTQTQSIYLNSKWKTLKQIQKNKQQQGKAINAFYKRLKVDSIFKLHVSSCGPSQSNFHYDQFAYKTMGKKLVEALNYYLLKDSSQQGYAYKIKLIQEFKKYGNKIDKPIEDFVNDDSQSQYQKRIGSQQRSYNGSSQKKRLKSKQHSSSNIHKNKNNYRVSERSSLKNNRKVSDYQGQKQKQKQKQKAERSSKSRLQRKRTEPKNTEPSALDINQSNQHSLSQRKSLKNLNFKNKKISSQIKFQNDYQRSIQSKQKEINSPIKIPKINHFNLSSIKRTKAKSYTNETPDKADIIKKTQQHQIKPQISKNNLKSIMEASSQMKTSQVQDMNGSIKKNNSKDKQIKILSVQQGNLYGNHLNQFQKGKNIIKTDFMGQKDSPLIFKNKKQSQSKQSKDRQKLSQIFQMVGIQATKNSNNNNNLSPYQLLKIHNKINQNPRLNQAINKLNNNNSNNNKFKSADK